MLKLLRRRKNNRDIDRILDGYELPSFPGPVITVLSKLRNPEAPIQDIADDLEVDPGLHVKVLRTVNSVAFGLSHKISSLRHAVSLLGRSRLESLVLSVGVKESLDRGLVPGWFDMQSFWLSAARRAALARGLAQILHPQTQAEAFTAGLLQDMGVPVMASLKGDPYRKLYQLWQQSNETDLAGLEKDHFDLAHPQLGAGIAERWDFPDMLIENVGRHHLALENGLDLAIHIASLITDAPGPIDKSALATRINQTTGLDRAMLEKLLCRIDDEAVELAGALA
ncbi:HDOD domain-containing protein [Geothermobacter hydrogeniphilus]|uniref:HDOD domain-containing protein n=1 Tax=Geothermobacter hydrogeniphilus TaxID=1969733 RepID=A0A1X0YCL9_9BACT|nr:HDOD domain-containing protein [Geothermobacter hydrogeniphilus]ORJ62839.1 hypothetical protein B5V00_01920 [Geothermobacter hydrogeniphilus]